MFCKNPRKPIAIFKGDDTNFDNNRKLFFEIESLDALNPAKIEFSFLGVKKVFDTIPTDGRFEVSFTREETAKFPLGTSFAVVTAIDSDNRERTLDNRIAILVTNSVKVAYSSDDDKVVSISFEVVSADVVAPDANAKEGQAADAKAVHDALREKQDKLIAGSHIDIAEDGIINTLGYKLVTLPAGETQLQDRANIHITEDNVIRTWTASTDYSGSFIDVDWVHKEVHDIGDGSGELEWYVARFDLAPGFYYPIVPVKDVRADYRYSIDYDSHPIPDDPSHGEYKGIVSEVSFVPIRITYGEVDYTANLYGDFRTKRPDTGEDITWVIDAYDTKCLLSSGGAYLYNDYVTATFGDNYTPPEWNEEDNLYWRFEVSGLSELPMPGETLKISLVLYSHNDDYNALATYEGEITLPEDLAWRFYGVYDFTLEGDATIRYSTPDGGTKEVVDHAAYLSIGDSYNYGFVDFNFNTSAQVLPGVTMILYQWKTVAESEEIQIPTIGEELVFSPSQSTDESSGYQEYFNTYLLMTESFTFVPPVPSFENRARDFLLCVDLTKDRQIELQDVTEVEEGLFALNAGRTLISVTEPIEGKLYASTRPLPMENA